MLEIENQNVERIPETIQKLKKEKNIYVYGDGDLAHTIIQELHRWNIKVEGILVSEGRKQKDTLSGLVSEEIQEFIVHNDRKIVIIAGYSVYLHKELSKRILLLECVDKLIVWDGCGTLCSNHFLPLEDDMELLDNYYVGLIKRDLNYNYFKMNEDKFIQTYDWLSDVKSKNIMQLYLNGHINLNAFPIQSEWKIEDVINQYFPEDVVTLGREEVFVDCGAYTGDTLEEFSRRVNWFQKYYALEPDDRRFEDIHKVAQNVNGEVIHLPIGAWDKKDVLFFSQNNACGEITENENNESESIAVDSVDNIVDINDKVTFIKMDIEGAELPALKGAENTIKKNKPKLAICVYHKREDLITIPQYIKGLVPEYRLYLRCHFPYASELVLYAIPM